MSRALRIEFPGAVYHVTSRGNERRVKEWGRILHFSTVLHEAPGIVFRCGIGSHLEC